MTPRIQRKSGGARGSKSEIVAFTLIELLAVIAIIGVLAGLVVGLSGIATTKSRNARMRGEHQRLITAIEAYKAEIGNYPPDNTNLLGITATSDPKDYHKWAGLNSLFYELSGAVFTNSASKAEFVPQNKSIGTEAIALKSAFTASGVQNSARRKTEIPYRGVSFKPDQHASLQGYDNVDILVTPLKGPYDSSFLRTNGLPSNPWFYDASSTNRHNADGFDLWAEYIDGRKTNTVGNWKE